ncbi:MAG: polysaccharide biosynthesis protein, partial [Pseudomonadota bacterium]|nr:polysaccharide biosynthesis protein [Pseudomonadota bacterium]
MKASRILAMMHDAIIAAASFLLAIWLRLGEEQWHLAQPYLIYGTWLFTLVCVSVCASMRLYRGLWRYASMQDMVALVKAVTLSILIFALLMFFINHLKNVPRSLFFINWMLLLVLLGAPRFIYRALHDGTLPWRVQTGGAPKIPVLLIGAGDHAEQFIRDMERGRHSLFIAVALVDDDPRQKGRTIRGVPILGATDALPSIVRRLEREGERPQKLILTDDRAAGETVRELLEMADRLGIPLARLPSLSAFKSGVSDRLEVRPIAVEDLLGRSQNVLDRDAMRALVEGRTVLITGAGGTIGAELTRQIACFNPAGLILVELSEFNLYQIERELKAARPD